MLIIFPLRRVLTVFVLLLAVSCSGGNPASPTSDGGGTPSIAPRYAETEAAIADAVAAFRKVITTHGTLEKAYAAAATSLKASSEVTHVDHTVDKKGNILLLAEFANGMLFSMPVVYLNKPLLSKSATSLRKPSSSMGLPGTRKALFLEVQSFDSNVSTLATLASQAGYEVVSSSSHRVGAFKNLHRYSLLYISSHGCYFSRQGKHYFAILTDHQRDKDDDLKFIRSGDFQDLSIMLERGVYVVPKEDPDVSEDTHYAVTNVFFKKYTGSFAKDSLVYIDMCHSTERASLFEPPPLVAALYAHGVKTYLGWSRSVNMGTSIRASNFILTHLLGKIPGGLYYVPEKKPPIRPFGLTDVLTALENKGWQNDTWGGEGAVLELMDMNFGGRDTLLLPNITGLVVNVDMKAQTQDMDVLGEFGSEAGEVMLCDSPKSGSGCKNLNVTEWTEEKIKVDLGKGCSDCTGYVVVTVDQRRSNAHPLTEWTPDVDVHGTSNSGPGGGPDVKLKLHLRFRTEIVDERAMPDGSPFALFAVNATKVGLDSSCDYEFSGTFTDSADGCVYEYRKQENSGSVSPSAGGNDIFTGAVSMAPLAQKLNLQVAFSRKAMAHKTCPGKPETIAMVPVALSLPLSDLKMQKYGAIDVINKQVGPYTVKTSAVVQPKSPPDDNTSR